MWLSHVGHGLALFSCLLDLRLGVCMCMDCLHGLFWGAARCKCYFVIGFAFYAGTADHGRIIFQIARIFLSFLRMRLRRPWSRLPLYRSSSIPGMACKCQREFQKVCIPAFTALSVGAQQYGTSEVLIDVNGGDPPADSSGS